VANLVTRSLRWPLAVAAAITMTAATAAPAWAGPAPTGDKSVLRPVRPPHPDPGPRVRDVHPVRFRFRRPANQADRRYTPEDTIWPGPDQARLTLQAPAATTPAGKPATAPQSPIWAQALRGPAGTSGPRTLRIRIYGQAAARAAGITGLLFTVTPASGGSGHVKIGLDYRKFSQAFGGNFGLRLHLVQLPECALTSPRKPACQRPTALRSFNDWPARTVSASLQVGGPIVLAATSSPGQEGSPAGNYAATSLKPSGTWTAGGSSGAFRYTYPITVPPAPSSLVPALALSYDSGEVDGQTASTQAQAGWAGDGWSTGESFIEQSFIPCDDKPEGTASPESTSDECYDGPVLTLSLDGQSTPLVCPSSSFSYTSSSTCALAADNGAVVRHVAGSSNGSGTKFTDYWTVTERDGTTYEFGRNELPGWKSGDQATGSVASLPVFSAHSGDPCYSSSGFSSSVCTMAYRWNLDYVTDAHGYAMAYYYNKSTNYYGEDTGAKDVSYVRDTYLAHIDYGFTDGNAYGTIPDKIVFGTGDRCTEGASACDPLDSTTAKNWPDVPYDLVCDSGKTCPSSDYAPSFFSTVRLTSITAEQYSVSQSKYLTVDSWALTQTLPATGDGTSPTLWLSKIQRTGSDTTAGGSSSPITLPPVTFTGIDLQNRVDTTTDGLPPLDRYRVSTITTETGSVITPNYTQPDPCTAPVTTTPSKNTSSCYPVYWTPSGYTQPYLDWFNTYVVGSVSQSDPTGGAPNVVTDYTYSGAAWHYDDNEVVQPKYRTYGQFRGYADVQTLTGNGANDPRTLTGTTYYQGMSDDNNDGITVMLTDSEKGQHEDLDQLAGLPLETTYYLGNGGPVDHFTITSYWVSGSAMTRTRSGIPDLTANFVAPAETYSGQALTDGGTTSWRYTETDTTYDTGTGDADFGLPAYVYSHTVPASAAYDRCTALAYAPRNSGNNLTGLVGQSETDSVACGGFTEGSPPSAPSALNSLTAPASVSRPDQVVSATRTFYDDPSFSTTYPQASAPGNADVSVTEQASGYSSGAFTWQVMSKTTYNAAGLVTASYDADGNKTSTSYATNSAGLITGMTVTNPLSQSTTTTIDPERGLTLTSTDPNSVTTTSSYDALGRVTAVWLASRATSSPANYTYAYTVSDTGVTAVTTKTLNNEGGYATSVTIYDAMLRPRQTQADTPQGGRMVTDTFYDSRGWVSARYNGWWDSATTPDTTLVTATSLDAEVPNQDYYTYDGLGRVVIDKSEKDNVVVSTTTTVYNGDRVTVIPPAGGTVTSTVTDPVGRTTETDQYTSPPDLHTPGDMFTGTFYVTGGSYQATAYGYDGHGNQDSVTDAAGDTWTTTYNLLGEATQKTDPVSGTTSMSYDPDGNLIQSTDARGDTISWTYDALGRPTAEYDAPVSGQASANELDSWVYDNSNGAVSGMSDPVGHLTTATAYWSGSAYTTQATGFNAFGEQTGEQVIIPSAEGALAGTYTFGHTYGADTGLPLTDTYPEAGGLPAATVLRGYAGVLDLPTTLGAGLTGYAQGVTYDAWRRVNQETIGEGSNLAYLTDSYDVHTGRLTGQLLQTATGASAGVDDETYTYDSYGNVTSQTQTRVGTTSETQCYDYDHLDRLVAAWTATDDCATQPTSSDDSMVGDPLGSASAYWTTWSYDAVGNRLSQVQHSLSGGADTTTSYDYNGSGAGQPGTLTSTSTSGGASGSASYGYDADGNMTSRAAGQGSQSLTWDAAGQLTAITGGTAGDVHYVYDASGSLLLQKDPGSTTLYLPGEQITLDTGAGTASGVRYLALPGGGIAYQTGTGTSYGFEITDLHGTPFLTLDNTAQVPTWRQFTPFGAPRGNAVTWFDNRAFLDKPADPATGLDYIGARGYDPSTGRFISLDPVFDPTDAQTLNGYAYAADNPATDSDPSGKLLMDNGGGGGCDSSTPGCPGYHAGRTSSGGGGWWSSAVSWVSNFSGGAEMAVLGALSSAVKVAQVSSGNVQASLRPNIFDQAQASFVSFTGLDTSSGAYSSGWFAANAAAIVLPGGAEEDLARLAAEAVTAGGARFVVDAQGSVTDLGVRVSADRPVVIGEAMQARVIPAAQKLGADWYQPPAFANDAQSLAHNRYWINEMMNQGRGIVDIGAAPGRANFPAATSPWYAMEQDQVAQRAYQYYMQYSWDW
jgi:RHS repeat-associated protein